MKDHKRYQHFEFGSILSFCSLGFTNYGNIWTNSYGKILTDRALKISLALYGQFVHFQVQNINFILITKF